MTDLRAVEPMYRPAERPAPSKPRRRVQPARRDTGPYVWQTDTPVSDWWAEWRPAVYGLLRLLLAVAIFGGAGWFIAVALLVEGK